MNFVKNFSLFLAVAFVCSISVAQESESKCSKCPSSSTAVSASTDEKECSGCPVTVAMKNLPAMTFKVGDESVCCSKMAESLAAKNDKPVQYVVGEKTFASESEAYTALVESTEAFVEKFITPSKCKASGTTSIAGSSCGCPVEAGKKVEMVKAAIKDIKMTYVVGETKCSCPNEAKSLAAKSDDAKTTYVVDGTESCCNLEARLNLAKAKYAAAVKALATTEKSDDKKDVGDSS